MGLLVFGFIGSARVWDPIYLSLISSLVGLQLVVRLVALV